MMVEKEKMVNLEEGQVLISSHFDWSHYLYPEDGYSSDDDADDVEERQAKGDQS